MVTLGYSALNVRKKSINFMFNRCLRRFASKSHDCLPRSEEKTNSFYTGSWQYKIKLHSKNIFRIASLEDEEEKHEQSLLAVSFPSARKLKTEGDKSALYQKN